MKKLFPMVRIRVLVIEIKPHYDHSDNWLVHQVSVNLNSLSWFPESHSLWAY